MTRQLLTFLILVLIGLPAVLCAQPDRSQKFAAAGYAGVTMSQVHGDSYTGYRKPGYCFGVETQVLLRPEWYVSVGIGYSREGAQPSTKEVDLAGGNAPQLTLSLIQVPVLLNYRIGSREATGRRNDFALYRRPVLQLGARLTRLVDFKTSNRGFFDQLLPPPPINEVGIEFRNLDISTVAGVIIPIGVRYAVGVQHALSMRGLYEPDELKVYEGTRLEVNQLRPYSISLALKATIY